MFDLKTHLNTSGSTDGVIHVATRFLHILSVHLWCESPGGLKLRLMMGAARETQHLSSTQCSCLPPPLSASAAAFSLWKLSSLSFCCLWPYMVGNGNLWSWKVGLGDEVQVDLLFPCLECDGWGAHLRASPADADLQLKLLEVKRRTLSGLSFVFPPQQCHTSASPVFSSYFAGWETNCIPTLIKHSLWPVPLLPCVCFCETGSSLFHFAIKLLEMSTFTSFF